MRQWQAVCGLILINALWGATPVAAKFALAEFPPTLLSAVRFVILTGLLWVILLATRRHSRRRPIERQDLFKLVGLGLAGVAANQLLGTWGMKLTTATDASLMIVGESIFTSILSVLIARERLGRWKLLGVACGVIGVVILVLNSATGGEGAVSGAMRALGDLLILAGLLGEAAYTILGSGLSCKYDPLTVLTIVNTGSLLIWGPALGWHLLSGPLPAASPAALGGMAYLILVSSLLCYLVWFWALPRAGANLGAISLFVQPLVGALLGIFLLGDPVTPGLVAGGVLVLAALYLGALPDRRAAVPAVAAKPAGD